MQQQCQKPKNRSTNALMTYNPTITPKETINTRIAGIIQQQGHKQMQKD